MLKLFKEAADPISSETHFIGACLSFLGLILLIVKSYVSHISSVLLLGSIIFGVSLILLYSASAIYHYFNGAEKIRTVLRKLDHSMIYILIVGTYTPVVLYCMEAPKSYVFLTVLWTIAILGVLIKIIWLDAPRALATAIYLLLGWSIVFDFQAFSVMPTQCLILIAAGGISYSIGAFIYIFKKPNFSENFGFHELFHIFVMLGSLFHYIAIFSYII